MERLRAPDGCPWDREQTFASIAPYTIEEAYEVADAIEREDLAHLKDELGDLLFQVVFHAQIARERGAFDFEAAAGAICDKLVRRHPHVFGRPRPPERRRAERRLGEHQGRGTRRRAAASALDGVPRALPALMRAHKLSKRAARVGFDFEHASQTADKVAEELAEVREAAAAHESAAAIGAAGASPRAAPSQEIFEEIGDLAVRRRQSRAQARRRRGGGAARREREIRAALSRHGSAARGARRNLLELEPRGAGGFVAGRETCRMRRRRHPDPVPLVFKHDPDLPIFARRQEILEALERHQLLIVAGDTGSGKSTQLPKYCLELGRGPGRGRGGVIAHTQPRRLAARSLAARIAEELAEPVGRTVGFRVRFADQVSEATRLVLMTDGLLLAELACGSGLAPLRHR